MDYSRNLNRRVEIINLDMPDEEPKKKSLQLVHMYNYTKEHHVEKNIYSDGTLFTIQISSFKTESKAQQQATLLRNQGHNVIVVKSQTGGDIYNIKLGYFGSLQEAKEYLSVNFPQQQN
jgi:hypothetical protein